MRQVSIQRQGVLKSTWWYKQDRVSLWGQVLDVKQGVFIKTGVVRQTGCPNKLRIR
ncbi:MAG: hypothetical protein QOJ64_2451 [Acidobacteriota bacterium]|jgi:hypothetical protein|nr:hypothetical protein [Acidobacteriota bacterium]